MSAFKCKLYQREDQDVSPIHMYSCGTHTGVSKILLIISRGSIELRKSIGRRNVEGNRRFWNKSCHVRKKASDS